MSILRTIRCDACGETFTEKDNGTGFPGWVIIQGIGAKEKKVDEKWEYKHLNMTLCPEHGKQLAELITNELGV